MTVSKATRGKSTNVTKSAPRSDDPPRRELPASVLDQHVDLADRLYRDGSWYCKCPDKQDESDALFPVLGSGRGVRIYYTCSRGHQDPLGCNMHYKQKDIDYLEAAIEKKRSNTATAEDEDMSPSSSSTFAKILDLSQASIDSILNDTDADETIEHDPDWSAPRTRNNKSITTPASRGNTGKRARADSDELSVVSIPPPYNTLTHTTSPKTTSAPRPVARLPPRSAKKGRKMERFYVISAGYDIGIFHVLWEDIRHLTAGYPDAIFKGADTIEEAHAIWKKNSDAPVPRIQFETRITKVQCKKKTSRSPKSADSAQTSATENPDFTGLLLDEMMKERSRQVNAFEIDDMKQKIRSFVTKSGGKVTLDVRKDLADVVDTFFQSMEGLKQAHRLELAKVNNELTTLKENVWVGLGMASA